MQDVLVQALNVASLEWHHSGERNIRHYPQAPKIRLVVSVPAFCNDFGSEVGRCAYMFVYDLAGRKEFAYPKVTNFHSILFVYQNVVQLYISVQDLLLMQVV